MWLQEMGLELLDEQTGQKMSGTTGSSTEASSVPQAWGPCESVFLLNVPPFWRSQVLQEVLPTQGRCQKVLGSAAFMWVVSGQKPEW